MGDRNLWEMILYPLEWCVEFVIAMFHRLFTGMGLSPSGGWTWVLAIAGLVIVVRLLLWPLYVKQITSSRKMQIIQPEMQKIQAKYKGRNDPESRQRASQEMMDLYRRTGVNPASSCLPLLLQIPILFALFSVMNGISRTAEGTRQAAGLLDQKLASHFEEATIFGAPLKATFMSTDSWTVRILAVILIIGMTVAMFITTQQQMTKNMPESSQTGQLAQTQKIMLYVMPPIFAITGVGFPIGVLIYWFFTNLWAFGQQQYVLHQMPTPGSTAYQKHEDRLKAKGKEVKKLTLEGLMKDASKKGGATTDETPDPEDNPAKPIKPGSGQRQQPKRNKKRR